MYLYFPIGHRCSYSRFSGYRTCRRQTRVVRWFVFLRIFFFIFRPAALTVVHARATPRNRLVSPEQAGLDRTSSRSHHGPRRCIKRRPFDLSTFNLQLLAGETVPSCEKSEKKEARGGCAGPAASCQTSAAAAVPLCLFPARKLFTARTTAPGTASCGYSVRC